MPRTCTPLPDVARADGLPEAVTIHEVGPRDGLQNESAVVPARVKHEFVRRLAAAGERAAHLPRHRRHLLTISA